MSYTLAYTGAEIDALLGKIDAIFVAEYGSTIYSEVTAAIAAGNKVIVANAGKVFVYAGTDDNSGYVFTQSGPNAAKPNATYVTLSTGNVWSTATVDLATVQQFYASLMEDTASGSIASFPDGAEGVPVKELTAEIEPIQDLHGYSNPWPPAGGKNKLPFICATERTKAGIKYTPNADGTVTANGTYTSGQSYYCITNDTNNLEAYTTTVIPAGTTIIPTSGITGKNLGARNTDGTYAVLTSGQAITLEKDLGLIYVGYNDNASNLVFKPMICLSTATDPTVFAPYFNECPIEGCSGAEISVTGKNLYNKNGTGDGFVAGKALLSGDVLDTNQYFNVSEYIKIKPSTAYTLQSLVGNAAALCFYDANKGYISGVAYLGAATKTVTSPATAAYIRFSVAVANADTIQLEEGSSATAYEAFGTTYSIDWTDEAGTVYKGSLNATTGVLTITHGSKTFSGSDSWGTQGSSMFYTRTDDLAHLSNYSAMMCSLLKSFTNHTATVFTTADYGITGYWDNGGNCPTQNWIYVKATGITSEAGLNTFFAANPATVVYPLGAPITVQLTPTEVQTLLGDNNIWSNTGDISVKYRCNTALYIEKKLGE